MHDLNDMLELLTTMSLHYPQARYTDAQLGVLAIDWAEDLAAYELDVLREAITELRRRERYFPGIATVIDYASAVLSKRRAAVRELPPPPMTPEKMTRNARLAWLIRRKVGGDSAAARELDTLLGWTAAEVRA